jgi:hypothetical protein
MAYIARARGRRYEIRESTFTPTGSRSRTLASFAVLDDVALATARSRAEGTIDASSLQRAARRMGAPVAESEANAAARGLVGELASGRRPAPGLEALLRRALEAIVSPPLVDIPGDMAMWVDADDDRRGRALVDLLGLGDRLPKPKKGRLAMPRLAGIADTAPPA